MNKIKKCLDELKKLGDENKNVYLLKMDITDIPSYPSIVKQVNIVNLKLVFVSSVGEMMASRTCIASIPRFTYKH